LSRISITITAILFFYGCKTNEIVEKTPVLAYLSSGEILPSDQAQLVDAKCIIEKNRVAIPSVAVARDDCSKVGEGGGFAGGFARGICQGQNGKRLAKAEELQNTAMRERKKVYSACLTVAGVKRIEDLAE
tara:strand:- start:88 stop:480 length:393 start_codon:yes stop_codon:yes gene_type:complete